MVETLALVKRTAALAGVCVGVFIEKGQSKAVSLGFK